MERMGGQVWMYGCMEMDGWEKESMRMNGGDGNEIINH